MIGFGGEGDDAAFEECRMVSLARIYPTVPLKYPLDVLELSTNSSVDGVQRLLYHGELQFELADDRVIPIMQQIGATYVEPTIYHV